MRLFIVFILSCVLASCQDKKTKKKHEISLKPVGSKDFKELKDNLDFDIE